VSGFGFQDSVIGVSQRCWVCHDDVFARNKYDADIKHTQTHLRFKRVAHAMMARFVEPLVQAKLTLRDTA
jgi:hypothetical protein